MAQRTATLRGYAFRLLPVPHLQTLSLESVQSNAQRTVRRTKERLPLGMLKRPEPKRQTSYAVPD